METLRYAHMESPVGALLLARDDEGLRVISFPSGHKARAPEPGWQKTDIAEFDDTTSQLTAYFDGETTEFDLPLKPEGTPFQMAVWEALQDIPYGETISYGELAKRIGKPSASRAVGAANGANPLPIVIPCHRVIGADNSLTGFGGGVDIKEFLLEHEWAVKPPAGHQPKLI